MVSAAAIEYEAARTEEEPCGTVTKMIGKTDSARTPTWHDGHVQFQHWQCPNLYKPVMQPYTLLLHCIQSPSQCKCLTSKVEVYAKVCNILTKKNVSRRSACACGETVKA